MIIQLSFKKMIKTKMYERLHALANALGKSDREFSITVSERFDFVNKAGDTINNESVKRILYTYPQVSLPWIMWGEGDMFFTDHNINGYILDIFNIMNKELQEKTAKLKELEYRLESLNIIGSEPSVKNRKLGDK